MEMLEVRLIGKFEIKYDGKPIAISSRVAQSLFAYLILNAGTPFRREKLAGMFWPDTTEEKARAYLRYELWRIRKAVPFNEYLLSDDFGITFNSATEYWLDAKVLEKLKDTALANELMAALSSYNGELLPGFYDEWITAEREHLQADYEQKMARLLDVLESEKRWLEILDWAEDWISFAQSPEAAYRYLMIAYDALGDRAKVASTYERCVQALRELDLEPSEQTRALAFKRASKLNIPIPLTSFIGREKELKEVANLISKSRLVTLTGSGGVGKTRLAIQVVADVLELFPDGVWFLDFAPLSEEALVPQVVLTTLGLIDQSGLSPLRILTDFLQARRTLLILDNCEHLIQASAQLAESLLLACPDLHVLATSREALRIAGEIPYRVPSLEIPMPHTECGLDVLAKNESVRLFTERAAVAWPGFAIGPQNVVVLAQICKRLDGIPLAIELAAARVSILAVEQILKRLDDRFNLLTRGSRTAIPRHQTLRATIDWSYALLSEQERNLFRRLAVFMGGWTLEAAEEVCSGSSIESRDVLDLLSQLVNKSQAVVENSNAETRYPTGGSLRYRRLETIRQYGRGKLWEAGEEELMHRRHLAYFVDLADQAEANLRSFDTVMWLDRLETELDNIREALAWAQESDVESQLRLASALLWFWHIRGHRNEGIDWLERGLAMETLGRGDQPLTPHRAVIRGNALNASGSLLALSYNYGRAPARLEESLALFQQLGPMGKRGMAYALMGLGGLPSENNQEGSLLEQSLTLFRELGDKFGAAECLGHLSGNAQKDGDYKQAVIFAEQQLALRREMGDQDGIASELGTLGALAFGQGDYQRANTLLEESLTRFRVVRNKWGVGLVLSVYGDSYLLQGDYERATKIYEEAFAFAENIGDRFLTAFNLYNLGVIAWFRGDYVGATQMIIDSLAVFRDMGHQWPVASSLHALGDIALAQRDEEGAVKWYDAEMEFARETQIKTSLAFAIAGLGKVAWAKGDYELAAKRFEEGLRISRDAALKPAMFYALCGLGRVAQSRGEYATARAFYAEALEIQPLRISPQVKWLWLKTYFAAAAYPLEGFALLAATQNQMQRTARLFGASEKLHTPLRCEMSAAERAEHDQTVAAARAVLGGQAFAAAYEEGKKMTFDEAVAYALEELQ
jgi:predicted ATPase/DNA-binding SARP family transcriptional activator